MTGSGITLNALVRHARAAGWDQCAVVGTSAGDPAPPVGGLPGERVHPLAFESDALPFPVPGMSDVMPYPSSRFSDMTHRQLEAYRSAWRRHLERVVKRERPTIIHVHHLWLVAGLLKDIAPNTPVLTHCHATGLRQLGLCPHLADEVRRKVRRNDLFLALHRGDADRLREVLDVPAEKIRIVGAGYREDLFNPVGRRPSADRGSDILFVGKYCRAKGLPWLLDAVERLARRREVRLHVAGGGSGEEAFDIERRMRTMAGLVELHGSLTQLQLADLMRRCAVCVLPSFYEGLPLILAESAACGCRLVATRLPGIVDGLLPALDPMLDLVPLPRLQTIDTPVADDLAAFTSALENAIDRALDASGRADDDRTRGDIRSLTWAAVFGRVESTWIELAARVAR